MLLHRDRSGDIAWRQKPPAARRSIQWRVSAALVRVARHCERSEAIQGRIRTLWIASLRSQ